MVNTTKGAVWFVAGDDAAEDKADPDDIIEFDVSPVIVDGGYIKETSVKLSRPDTTIDNPDPDIFGSYQETGPNGIEITVTGLYTAAVQSIHKVRKNLKVMFIRDQVTLDFPVAAIGLRLNDYPEYSVTPTAERGYVILDVEDAKNADVEAKAGFVMKLRLIGNRGAFPYNWS